MTWFYQKDPNRLQPFCDSLVATELFSQRITIFSGDIYAYHLLRTPFYLRIIDNEEGGFYVGWFQNSILGKLQESDAILNSELDFSKKIRHSVIGPITPDNWSPENLLKEIEDKNICPVDLDEVLEVSPSDVSEKLLFHLDLFISE